LKTLPLGDASDEDEAGTYTLTSPTITSLTLFFVLVNAAIRLQVIFEQMIRKDKAKVFLTSFF